MGSKKEKFNPLQSFESTNNKLPNGSKDSYARITESLFISEAFQDLEPKLQLLYIAMRLQYYGKRPVIRDFNESSPIYDKLKSDLCFYFPWHTAKKYFSRYEKNSRRLYQDIRVLIEHGFIESVISGRNTRKNSIYKFSDKWREWKKPP